jgi:hypothetical protein
MSMRQMRHVVKFVVKFFSSFCFPKKSGGKGSLLTALFGIKALDGWLRGGATKVRDILAFTTLLPSSHGFDVIKCPHSKTSNAQIVC